MTLFIDKKNNNLKIQTDYYFQGILCKPGNQPLIRDNQKFWRIIIHKQQLYTTQKNKEIDYPCLYLPAGSI